MSRRRGKMITCDRCGREVFLAGRLFSDAYEPLPEGWCLLDGLGHFCPECYKKLTQCMKDFYGVIRDEELPDVFRFPLEEK